jgi:hypothetical protein
MMRIVEIGQTVDVANISELENILMRRHGDGYNSFWLCHDEREYPALSLLIKNDLATLNYIPKEQDAGYRSVGDCSSLTPGDSTAFSISASPADDVFVLNDAIVPFSTALTIAKEFFVSDALSRSIRWLKL